MAEQKKDQSQMYTFAEVEKKLRQAFGNPQVGLRTFKDIQVLQRAIFKQEALRLQKKLGPEHPRVLKLNARLEQNRKLIRAFDIEKQKASVRIPKVEAEEALIHGRAVTPAKLGVESLSVFAEDKKGNVLSVLGEAKTDLNGFYAFKADAAAVAELEGQEIYITLRDAQGNLIQRESEAIQLSAGARVYRDVSVSFQARTAPASAAQPKQKKAATRKKKASKAKPKPEVAPWIVRGSVVDAAGNAVPGVLVRLFDKDRLYDDLLGATQTGKKGQFEIKYRLQDFREGLEPGADLYLTVTDAEGNVLYSSKDAIRFDAGREEEYDIELPDEDDSDSGDQ